MQRDWGRKGGLRDPEPQRWTGPGIARERLDAILAGFEGRRVLVVGDLMLDEYVWGRVNRISPEAPVMVVDVVETTHALGGAGNVVNNIQAMGASALVSGVVGDDPNGLAVRERLQACGSAPEGVVTAPDRPTTVKTRIVAHSQQVVRVDREQRTAIPEATLAAVSGFVRDAVARVDAVLLSDYSKGVLVDSLVRDAVAAARAAGKPVAANLKPPRVEPFSGATLLTLNVHEAERATGIEITDEPSLLSAGCGLRERLACSALKIGRAHV
jgi:rfaE bifunctional protein kinase chain/domain